MEELNLTKNNFNEEVRRKFREKARQFEKTGCANKEFGSEKFNKQLPEQYANIVELTNDEFIHDYGSVAFNNLCLQSKISKEDFESAIMKQVAMDEKITTSTLHDPNTEEEILYGEFIKKYGVGFAEEAERGHYEFETRKKMKERHEIWLKEGHVKDSAQKLSRKSIDQAPIAKEPQQQKIVKSYTGTRYFLKTTRGLIVNPEYIAMFKNKGYSVIYEYMWSHIVRQGWKDTPDYPIKAKYYDNGFLAYCSSYRHLGNECGLDKNYVHKIVDEFNDKNIIKLELLVPEGKKFGQMVAILGEWKSVAGSIEESFYRDKAFDMK